MLLLQSFIVYTLFAVLMYSAAKSVTVSQSLAMQHPHHWFSLPSGYWWCILIFAIVSGIRWDVGVDHLSYLDNYVDALRGIEWQRERGIEEGYALITNYFAALGIHPTIYFAFLAFLQIFFFMLAFRTERSAIPFMMLCIVLGNPYTIWMNGIRQMIAACMFVYASTFLKDRRWLPYILIIAIAYYFHHSALILIPVYCIVFDKRVWDEKWLCLIIVIVCFVFGNMPTWISIMERFGSILSFIGYDYYSEQLEELVSGEMRGYNFGPRKMIVFISYLITIYMYPTTRQFFTNSNIDIIYKLFFIGVCLFYLFDNTLVIFRRPVRYFDIFAIPMFGYTLSYLKNSKKQLWFYLLLICCIAFIYLQCYADACAPEIDRRSSLYQFYFGNAKF